MNNIGKIRRVPLREVWKHEARNFSSWLEDNIELLNELIGIELANPEREKSAGAFNVDILAEDDQGHSVVIENQLEKSDHDHLGKLITYVSAFQAKTAIWIVAEPRPEHIQAITWLNESLTTNFYLIKVEAIRIEESPAAPLLTLIVAPSEESKEVGITKKDIAEREILRHRFWTGLLKISATKTKLHSNIAPTKNHWIGTGAGKAGLSFNYIVRQHDAAVELYIDRGKELDNENLEIFDKFYSEKEEIEKFMGCCLSWERLEGKRACRIKKKINTGGYRDDEADWEKVQIQMVQAMIQLENTLRPLIIKLST
jgi:hypothetical protein